MALEMQCHYGGRRQKSCTCATSVLENTSQSWLLIFDNADYTDMDLSRYFPKGEKGNRLITTRLIESTMLQTRYEVCTKSPAPAKTLRLDLG